jgi:hypothetical protein
VGWRAQLFEVTFGNLTGGLCLFNLAAYDDSFFRSSVAPQPQGEKAAMNSEPNRSSSEALDPLRLPKRALLTASSVDHADWNYRPVLGRIQRIRFDLVRSMLRESQADRLLEIGYESNLLVETIGQISCGSLEFRTRLASRAIFSAKRLSFTVRTAKTTRWPTART